MRFLCLIIILMPSSLLAGTPEFLKEYHTWGNFDVVCTTFERIALIMSDSRYFVMIFCVAVLGLVFGQFKAYLHMFKRGAGQMTLLYGAALFFIGITIYLATIVPKTEMHVYDKSYNQYKPVGNLPVLLVWTAGLANYFERTFIDMIETSSDPLSYENSAGGNVLSIVHNFFNSRIDLSSSSDNSDSGPDRLFQLSLRKYLYDCVSFEMSKKNALIDANDFFNTSDFKQTIAKANSMAVYTRYYDKDALSGRTCSCEQSWANLDQQFMMLNSGSSGMMSFVNMVGRDSKISVPDNNSGTGEQSLFQTVDTKITDFFNHTVMKNTDTQTDISTLFTQWLIANELWNAMEEADVKTISSRNTGVAMTGAGIMANEWVPVMRGVMFATYMCLFPFLTLLVVTPMAGRALQFMLASFVFFAAWSVCDVIVHNLAMDQAVALFEGLKNQQLGLNNLFMFSDRAAKGLAVLGGFKFSSMAIAGIMTGVLVKSGGRFAESAGSMMNMAEQQGIAGMNTVHSPGQRASAYHGLASASGTDHLANTGGQYGMQAADSFRQEEAYSSAHMTKKAFMPGPEDIGYAQNVPEDWASNRWGGGSKDLESIGVSTSLKNMSPAQSSAYAGVANKAQNMSKTQEMMKKTDDFGEGISNIKNVGGVQGRKENVGINAYKQVEDHITEEQMENLSYMDYIQAAGPGLAKKALGEYLENGKPSYFTKNQLKNFTEKSEGQAVLQSASRGINLSNVSQKQADTINKMAAESGLTSEGQNFIEAGHSVTMDIGYDRETGELSCSNLSAEKRMSVNEGTQVNQTTGIFDRNVTEDGLTDQESTLDGTVVHTSTRKGEEISEKNIKTVENVTPEEGHTTTFSTPKGDVGFETSRKGEDLHYYNENRTEHSGVHADRDDAANIIGALVRKTYPNRSEEEQLKIISEAVAGGRAARELASVGGAIQGAASAVKAVRGGKKSEPKPIKDSWKDETNKIKCKLTGKTNDKIFY
jgi:hypothetical protein